MISKAALLILTTKASKSNRRPTTHNFDGGAFLATAKPAFEIKFIQFTSVEDNQFDVVEICLDSFCTNTAVTSPPTSAPAGPDLRRRAAQDDDTYDHHLHPRVKLHKFASPTPARGVHGECPLIRFVVKFLDFSVNQSQIYSEVVDASDDITVNYVLDGVTATTGVAELKFFNKTFPMIGARPTHSPTDSPHVAPKKGKAKGGEVLVKGKKGSLVMKKLKTKQAKAMGWMGIEKVNRVSREDAAVAQPAVNQSSGGNDKSTKGKRNGTNIAVAEASWQDAPPGDGLTSGMAIKVTIIVIAATVVVILIAIGSVYLYRFKLQPPTGSEVAQPDSEVTASEDGDDIGDDGSYMGKIHVHPMKTKKKNADDWKRHQTMFAKPKV